MGPTGPFDAELYLRLAGERTLLETGGQNRGWWNDALRVAADALCAIGAIEQEAAQRIADDYALAFALREEGHAHHLSIRHTHAQQPQAAPQPLRPRRVVPCDRRIDTPDGELHVRYVSLAGDATRLGVTFRKVRTRRRRGGGAVLLGGHGSWPGGPPEPKLVDDRGTTTPTSFSGGGSDTEWDGHLTAETPLAEDARWIEVDGARIDLVDEPLRVDVRVEQLPDENQALGYLWRRVATATHFHHDATAVDAAVDATVAAGAIAADDPQLEDVRRVSEALEEGRRPRRARDLPEPWKSLFARGRRADGPTGTVAVGAVSPAFDGVSVAVMSVDSNAEGFSAEVEMTGGFSIGGPFETTVGATQLVWWATDDRGNSYLGHIGDWSSSNDHAQGTIEFSPPLDPRASRLCLLPTAQTSRCAIEFPLPWATPGGPGQ